MCFFGATFGITIHMKILDKLMLRWGIQNVGLMPGNSVSEIEAAFAHLGCEATTDVMALYSKMGGMHEMENDAYWRLWSLTEVVERNTESSPYGILFSDHLINSWCYRLRHETDSRSSIYIDYFDSKRPPEKLFDGLEEFFTAYERNPDSILG